MNSTTSSNSSNSSNHHHHSNRSDQHDTWAVRLLNRWFRHLGTFIGNHAPLVLTIMLVITAICAAKIPLTKIEDDLKRGWTPAGARAYDEMAVYENFFKSTGEPVSVFVFVLAKDDGSMQRLEQLNETINIIDFVSNNFTIANNYDGGQASFAQFCAGFCNINEPVRLFYRGFLTQQERLRNNETINDRINLNYPIMSVLGRQFNLYANFFGVTKQPKSHSVHTSKDISQIADLRMILLHFRAELPQSQFDRHQAAKWEIDISDYYHNVYQNDYVRPLVLSTTLIQNEIVRAGTNLLPFILVGLLFMSIFSITTVCLNAAYYGQLSKNKIFLALMACVCPLFACGTALGLLFWMGMRFGTILCVTPFLVLAVGVDDGFLMIHTYMRIARQLSETPSADDTIANRLGEMFVDIGPSITIAALTNVLGFTVGLFTPIAEIQLFCIANALGMSMEFVFQITVFAAIMALAHRNDPIKADEIGKSESNTKVVDNRIRIPVIVDAGNTTVVVQASGSSGATVNNCPLDNDRCRLRCSRFLRDYTDWLSSKFTSFILLMIMIVYWYVSIRGAMRIEAKLTPEKLFLSDSVLQEVNTLRERYIWPHYTVAIVFVDGVGNLSEPNRIARLNQLVHEFEHFPESVGPESTMFWLRDFEQFRKFNTENNFIDYDYAGADVEASTNSSDGFDDENRTIPITAQKSSSHENSNNDLDAFLKWPEYQHWSGFIRYEKTNDKHSQYQLTKFFFTTAFHGDHLLVWSKRADLLNQWRAIADNYRDLQVSVYEEDAPFLDQIASLIPVTTQDAIITLISMAIVCILFMWNVFSVVIASLAIISICIGVFGILSWWGVDLDPITVSTTMMSIGFSVGFPAHITYHYYRTGLQFGGRLTCAERLQRSISAIGYPLIQGGSSTVLCLTSLLFAGTYMSEVFVKTMFLVVLLGLIHGLILVPALLSALTMISPRLGSGFIFRRKTSRVSAMSVAVSAVSSVESKRRVIL